MTHLRSPLRGSVTALSRGAALGFVLAAAPLAARECTLDGQPVNLDNGSTTAGRSGRVICFDDDGTVLSEQELRDGRFIGFERRRDLWGAVHERQVNANGNTEGTAREFWPDGTLKSEARYTDGARVGVGRTFDRAGKPASIDYATPGAAPDARVELDPRGRLAGLQCGARSLLEEDRIPCGFAGRKTTTLYRRDRAAERVTYEQGRLVRHETLDAEGAVEASIERDGEGEVRRRFHPDGRPAEETVVAGGFVVVERAWYMNGQLRHETTREAAAREGLSETRRWRDDGTQAEAETRRGNRTLSQTRHDDTGRVQLIEDFDAEGRVERRRRFDAQGNLAADDYLHPDGSRKAPPVQVGGG